MSILKGYHDRSSEFSIESSGLKLGFEIHNHSLKQHCIVPDTVFQTTCPGNRPDFSGQETALHCSGRNRLSQKIVGGDPGHQLKWAECRELSGEQCRQVTFVQCDPVLPLIVYSDYFFYEGIPVIRRGTRLKNESNSPIGIEYCSSAMMNFFLIDSPQAIERDLVIHWASNHWMSEAQWHQSTPRELGWYFNGRFMVSKVQMSIQSSMSSGGYLPMGMIENCRLGITWFWQIEHSGPWYWELGYSDGGIYLYLGGPDEHNHHAWKNLTPDEEYRTVPVAIGCVHGGFDEAVAALTDYRRRACLPMAGSRNPLPVIFNDYMNCLGGDPTTEKLLPIIDAASEVGCDYFVIDAGWYGDIGVNWWDTIGQWEPSTTRFPGGLGQVMAYIRERGMIAGLWFEIELAGINSALNDKPDDWFFLHHGRRFIDGSRYFLDFRNPNVREFASQVFDRMIDQFKLGYIKRDYNCSTRFGTDHHADSPGQGLHEHTLALIDWLDDVRRRYPDLILENCSGGGMRTDYQMLSHHDLHSSSDQEDYRRYPAILVGEIAAVLPEQMATWSYPLSDADLDQTAFNMVNAMLCRIHQSGRIHEVAQPCREMVKQAIALYKSQIRRYIPESIPFFPLGLPSIIDEQSPVALGMRHPETTFMAIWRLNGDQEVSIDSPCGGRPAKLIYPLGLDIQVNNHAGKVLIRFPRPFMAAVVQF